MIKLKIKSFINVIQQNKEFEMMKIFSLSRYGGKVLGLLLLATFLFTAKVEAQNVTKPQSPLLSLTADGSGYDYTIYPDGRLWIPPSSATTREILVPVFIQNNFFTFDATQYVVPPIYSFKFSIFYDAAAVQATGVQTTHPSYMEDILTLDGTIDEDPPFAYGWNIKWDDKPDYDFWKYIDYTTWDQIKDAPGTQVKRGRRVTITGTSTQPMRHNDKTFTNRWYVLLYVKFKIIGKQNIGDPNTTYLQTPMYISPDEIKYNDLDVTKDLPYKGFSHIFKDPSADYPALPAYPGVGGLNNEGLVDEEIFLKEPYRPGSIMVRISNGEPQFNFPSDVNEGYTINKISPDYWELEQIITVDSNNTTDPFGRLKIIIANEVERSRLTNIEIESSEPWLFTTTDQDGKAKRKRTINYLDNDILGVLKDPAGQATVKQSPYHLNIICDPTKLKLNDPTDQEKAGFYEGYLTFKSPVAKYNNVRLKVKFLFIRNPYEPRGTANPEGYPGGIFLNIRNSRSSSGDNTTLVFGTGPRGTVGVDSLYGEYHPATGLATGQTFDARFFPYPPVYPKTAAKYPNGYGDFAPNARAPRTGSKDIRDFDNNRSHIFYVRFNAGGVSNYPVVVSWDVRQFPAGARVFLRDTLNGQLFQPIDMRNGTPLDGEGNVRSFTINDASITSFLIEYTLPKDIKFLDANEKPIIKKGWNFVSLPVRPVNPTWNVFYPRAINVPYFFSQNQYQPETSLRVGVGYFVKYGDSVDKFFNGTEIREVVYPFDKVKVYAGDKPDVDDPTISGGWNAIGSVSAPMNITDISFTQFEGSPVPTIDYTLKYGVWGYSTDLGYREVSQILPGLGYWIKVNNTGYLKLVAPFIPEDERSVVNTNKEEILLSTTKLTIADNEQHTSNLYLTNNSSIDNAMFELPPVPPAGLFDVRFNNNLYLSNTNESVVKLQGTTYPVLFTIDNPNAEYTISDAVSGKVFGTIDQNNRSVVVNNTTFGAVKIERVDNVTNLNVAVYPNPVAGISTVNFTVVENGNVTIKLYNEVGSEVMTLVNGNYNNGAYAVSLNNSNLPAGAYLLKITNGSNFQVTKINVVK